MLECSYQSKVIKRIKTEFPNAVVLKNDPNYIQGIPDLLVLNGRRWAALEVKRSSKAKRQPNQDYYISKLGKMGYASYICPENEQEVFDDLQRSLQA